MTSQTAWNQLSAQALIERAYALAEDLQNRDEEEAASLIRHLSLAFQRGGRVD